MSSCTRKLLRPGKLIQPYHFRLWRHGMYRRSKRPSNNLQNFRRKKEETSENIGTTILFYSQTFSMGPFFGWFPKQMETTYESFDDRPWPLGLKIIKHK